MLMTILKDYVQPVLKDREKAINWGNISEQKLQEFNDFLRELRDGLVSGSIEQFVDRVLTWMESNPENRLLILNFIDDPVLKKDTCLEINNIIRLLNKQMQFEHDANLLICN